MCWFDESKRPRHRWVAGILAAVVLAVLAGCGSGRLPVHGDVTFDGKPVDLGTISFEPADGQGRATGGKIMDGKYELIGNTASQPGKKIVRIYASRKTGRKVPVGLWAPGQMVDEVESYIPEIYNTQSTLTCEVTNSGSNQIDFNLKSK
jgi:hypothetical protein